MGKSLSSCSGSMTIFTEAECVPSAWEEPRFLEGGVEPFPTSLFLGLGEKVSLPLGRRLLFLPSVPLGITYRFKCLRLMSPLDYVVWLLCNTWHQILPNYPYTMTKDLFDWSRSSRRAFSYHAKASRSGVYTSFLKSLFQSLALVKLLCFISNPSVSSFSFHTLPLVLPSSARLENTFCTQNVRPVKKFSILLIYLTH